MVIEKVKQMLRKQHYFIVGEHSAVQICRWTKKSIKNEGSCYKEQFYGIKSHLCCQMTPAVVWCQNKCMHCWRAVEYTSGSEIKEKIDSVEEIIDGCIKAQRKLLQGFKIDYNSKKIQLSRADMGKYKEAQEPVHFAISLSGEPTIYPRIGELIEELRRRGKTSFLVTNGLCPERLKELSEKNQLPTQLYVSVNAPNEKVYNKLCRSSVKDAWKKVNESLELLKVLKCRTVFRMNLIRELNMKDEQIKEYARLIDKAKPMFVEVKGYMSVGFARNRLGYNRMPTDKEMQIFVEKLAEETGLNILDSHKFSRAWVLGRSKKELKIQKI